MTKLRFLQLNEVSFPLVKQYIDSGVALPGFEVLFKNGVVATESESEYRNVEPWIQWYSIHTGLSFDKHGIFRLGDGGEGAHEHIFARLSRKGVSVGAISPMNCGGLHQIADFFVPDPWTETKPSQDWRCRFFTDVIRQAVNDNSQEKVSAGSAFKLLAVCFMTIRLPRLLMIGVSAVSAFNDHIKRALWLDAVIYEFYESLRKKNGTDFSVVFLNGCAHIQHHYLHASHLPIGDKAALPGWYCSPERDPILEAYRAYDELIQAALTQEEDLIIATGLSQQIYPDPIFYYRLRDHEKFLSDFGINFSSCLARMTRDFLLTFESNKARDQAKLVLEAIVLRGVRIFGELDLREKEIFVVLTYPHEIFCDDVINYGSEEINIGKAVVFVALKNGRHSSVGYIASNNPSLLKPLEHKSHVSELFGLCDRYF